MTKTIVVVGAGKGLGNHVAKLFGQKGLRVIWTARNENALEEYISVVTKLMWQTPIIVFKYLPLNLSGN